MQGVSANAANVGKQHDTVAYAIVPSYRKEPRLTYCKEPTVGVRHSSACLLVLLCTDYDVMDSSLTSVAFSIEKLRMAFRYKNTSRYPPPPIITRSA